MSVFILKNDHGVALLITLMVITILITVAFELNRKVRSYVISTAIGRDRITLTEMAETGIDIAQAFLVNDKEQDEENSKMMDSLFEDWAAPESINEALAEIPFDNGNVTVTITDELSKIQVNALVQFPKGTDFNGDQQILWDRFLGYVLSSENPEDDSHPVAIINSVKDWLDSDDDDAITGLTGAESDYYEGLEPPYACKNGPFTHLNELYLVKGITKDLLQGMENTDTVSDLLSGLDLEIDSDEMAEQISGSDLSDLSMYMTVYGMVGIDEQKSADKIEGSDKKKFSFNGRVNINTAELPVLTAILETDSQDLAPAIYEYRETDPESDSEEIPDLSSLNWYKSAPGCSDVKINETLIAVTSDFFRITATAVKNDVELTITSVVQREKNKKLNKWECRVLSWEVE